MASTMCRLGACAPDFGRMRSVGRCITTTVSASGRRVSAEPAMAINVAGCASKKMPFRGSRSLYPMVNASSERLSGVVDASRRWMATSRPQSDEPMVAHFRSTSQPHPLLAKPKKDEKNPLVINHIWSKEEVDERLANLWQHQPKTTSDKIMHSIMWGLYKSFNWVTGFKPDNTPVKSVEWRLIVLESFAGVPGFMAAMFRHFRSLRTLQRDHGWIHTLLEEAENERMHLLVCMKMFHAGFITRLMVMGAQVFMTPFLAAIYVVKPGAVHRFVGYLEETACLTYANIIHQVETPGTPLHDAWAHLPAPDIAKTYWKLSDEALWVDALKCMFADECNHRDVNHTFATMATDDPNPFIEKHKQDAVHAWRLETEGGTSDLGCHRTLGTKQSEQQSATVQ